MSEKADTARRALSALRNGNPEELGLALDPDIAVRATGGLRTHRYKGLDALTEAYREAGRHFDAPSLRVDSLKEDEDGAVLLAGSVHVRQDGKPMRFAVKGVLLFRDGLIHRVYLRRTRRGRG
jgi:ketosteroid isomerase-like protein